MQTEYSPDSQLRLIKEYAGKNNMVLPEEFIFADEGISGRKADKRPAFQKMLYEAKKAKFEVILIYHTSRFARNHEESVVYRSMLKREGIELLSITQPNIDEKTDLLMNALYAVMDERYSLDLSENVRRGMIEKAMRGECVSSVPFGYKMSKETNSPVIIEDKAKIVRLIFDKYLIENHSPYSIAKHLNQLNIPSPMGKKWERARIDQILLNPFYCGYLRWNIRDKNKILKDEQEWIIRRGNQPKIINEEEHNIVLGLMAKSKKLHTRGNVKLAHWLTGLVRCASCGAGLNVVRSTTKGNPPYYRCRAYAAAKCTQSQYVKAAVLERYLFESLEQAAISPKETFFEKTDLNRDEGRREDLGKFIGRAEKRMRRIKEAYESGIDTIWEYRENKKKITDEINDLNERLQSLDNKPGHKCVKENQDQLLLNIRGIKSLLMSTDYDNETKYKAIGHIVSKIVYDKKTNGFEVFYNTPYNALQNGSH